MMSAEIRDARTTNRRATVQPAVSQKHFEKRQASMARPWSTGGYRRSLRVHAA